MKQKKYFFGGLLALALVLSLSVCSGNSDDDNNNNTITNGLLTITGIPQGYILNFGYVMNNPNITWTTNSYDNSRRLPGESAYASSVNGQLQKIDGSFNTASISSLKYEYTNGVWESKWLNESFKYTGNGSVYVYFNTGENPKLTSWIWNDVAFSNGNATVAFPDLNDPGLTNDIDASLYGTWKDNATGDILTITFASSGITWGGTVGSPLNTATSVYQGTDYTFVWVASNGNISYKYSYKGSAATTMTVYTYELKSNGELELKAPGMAMAFATMVKQP